MPSLAGPRRPQDRVALSDAKASFASALPDLQKGVKKVAAVRRRHGGGRPRRQLEHGSVVIAAITSCTNTSNPSVMIAAGLVAKKAVERGLTSKPWVKTSLAPGSKVVTEYLAKAGLQTYLDELGFNLVGYGCTTCIGNSGPLPDEIAPRCASAASSSRRCCPAIATSRAASSRTCAPTTWRRRRWSSPTRWPAR